MSPFLLIQRIKNHSTKDVLSLVFSCICVCLCFQQIFEVTNDYFEYRVTTKVKVRFPEVIYTPSVTLCFRLTDLINLTLFNEKYGMSIKKHPKGTPIPVKERIQIQSAITMGDIFDMTPSQHDNFLHSCTIRRPEDYRTVTLSKEDCLNKVFSLVRFQIMEYVCYTFFTNKTDAVNMTKPHNLRRLGFSLSHPSVFYSIQLSTAVASIKSIDFTRPVVHSGRETPFTSITLSPWFWRRINDYKGVTTNPLLAEMEVNVFLMSYRLYNITFLPAPYETDCSYRSQNRCMEKCVNRAILRIFKKHPFQVTTTERDIIQNPKLKEYQLLSKGDMEQHDEKVRLSEESCRKECSKKSCKRDFATTFVTIGTSSNQSIIDFTVSAPIEPYVTIKAYPKNTFNDYVLMALTLIGFWFGISALQLNPTDKLIQWMERKKGVSKVSSDYGMTVRVSVQEFKRITRDGTTFCHRTRKLLRQMIDSMMMAIIKERVVEK